MVSDAYHALQMLNHNITESTELNTKSKNWNF
jgi:hypothetical protein